MLHAEHKDFGKTPDGAAVSAYTLKNRKSTEVTILTYGGIIQSIKTRDRKGVAGEVVLGFDDLAGYIAHPDPYFGALVGRYANRIAKGRFTLNGTAYKLDINNGPNSLHGGARGFDKRIWTAREIAGGVELSYLSKDGEDGYPGNLKVTVAYKLSDSDELRIEYSATTDKDTVVNLTNHSYFNLRGEGDILGHILTLNADRFTPVDSTLIPTGEIRDVAETSFDFRRPTAIGSRIGQADEQLRFGNGYDHNFVLNGSNLRVAARAEELKTGRVLEVLTDQPGVQFYSGNFLDGTFKGHGGKAIPFRGGFCLETQHFPDSPNHREFPSAVLKAGATFHSTTMFRFSTR